MCIHVCMRTTQPINYCLLQPFQLLIVEVISQMQECFTLIIFTSLWIVYIMMFECVVFGPREE